MDLSNKIRKHKLLIILISFIMGGLFGEIWLLTDGTLENTITIFLYSGLYWGYIGGCIAHSILMYVNCFLKGTKKIKILLAIFFPFWIAIFWALGVLSLIPYLIYSIVKMKRDKTDYIDTGL